MSEPDLTRLPQFPRVDAHERAVLQHGACRGQDDLFLNPQKDRQRTAAEKRQAAVAVCGGCPVLRSCRIVGDRFSLWSRLSFYRSMVEAVPPGADIYGGEAHRVRRLRHLASLTATQENMEPELRQSIRTYVEDSDFKATLVGRAWDLSEPKSVEEFQKFLLKHMKGVLDVHARSQGLLDEENVERAFPEVALQDL